MKKTNRGSEWNKWDLHIHTPASFFWKGKKLNEMTDDEKNTEIKNFIEVINKSDVTVFCLMDYWTFDWYIELQNYLISNPDELKKTIFPGMELRVECPVDYRLNIHCILSDKLTLQELKDFKSELYIRSIDKKLSDDALMKFALSLDDSKAKKHGFNSPTILSDAELLELGSKTAEITKESLKKAFNQIPIKSGFIIMPYDTSDGLLKLNWEDHPHADNYFMQSADIFETRDESNIELITGIRTEANKKIFDNFFKTLGSKAKPCIAGSDAHRYADYGIFPSNKVTWVKADLTFEGLKQIIFEPTERVKIQPHKPDYKEEKLIIDKVKFISSNNKFTPVPIKFNNNLNVIIGGKSSGKSILLYCIASTLETNGEVSRIMKDKYDLRRDDPNFNFEVTSLAGISQKLYDSDQNSIIPNVKYISQGYLTELAEPKENKKGEDLLKYVRGLLLEDEDYKSKYDNFLSIVKSNDKKREDIIDNYFAISDNVFEKNKELKEKGNEEVLKKSIKSNEGRISLLKKSIGLTQEQIKQYNDKQKELDKLSEQRTKIANDYKKIPGFNRSSLNTLKDLKNRKELMEKSLETEQLKETFTAQYKFLGDSILELEAFVETYKVVENKFVNENIFKKLLIENKSKREKLEREMAPFIKDKKVRSEILGIEKVVTNDKKTLQSIAQLKKEIKANNEELKKEKEKLFKLYIENSEEYPKIIKTLTERTELLEEKNLEIIGSQKFNVSKFKKSLLEISDGRSFPEREYTLFQQENGLIEFDNKNHLNQIKKLFSSIVENKDFVLNSKTKLKTALNVLLDDYFVDFWETEYDNDKMGDMSPGKASFVILMLIVGLSSSKAPILIDQPEDNLDNRSITKELVKYLRDKKLERQIILVTHNPNVVVNADAENIIVANQKGQNDKETSSPYRFDYTNGSMEYTKQQDNDEKDLLKSMGIREHIADIVEGGKEAFKKREEKYGF